MAQHDDDEDFAEVDGEVDDRDNKYRAPALSKGLDILEHLANEPDGKSQAEIAKTLGRTTSEIFRMLMVLRKRGYVQLNDEGDRYRLTTKLFEIAHRHPPIRRLTSVAVDAMQALANRVNQSIHLGILHQGRVLVIAQVDCRDNNITAVRLGAQIPLFDTSSGRVLAAWLEDAALAELMAEAEPQNGPRQQSFLADLPEVRELGYAINSSFTIEGVVNISAPIRDLSGRVVAATTVPFVKRLSGTSVVPMDEVRTALVAMARSVSRQLGAGARE